MIHASAPVEAVGSYVAERVQCPPDFVAVGLLVAAAAVIGGHTHDSTLAGPEAARADAADPASGPAECRFGSETASTAGG